MRTWIAALLCISATAHAQGQLPGSAPNYPVRPVRLIIPQAAGGATDIFIRTVIPKLSETLGQQVVVDNRPGANGVIGDEMAVKAPADGYTFMANAIGIVMNPSLYKLNYDITRDLQGITRLGAIDLLIGIHPSVPAKNVAELIAHAKANPNKLNYASFGVGSISHVAGEMFKQASGTQIVHVPFKSSGQAMESLLGNHLAMQFGGISSARAQIEAGKIRAIAVTGKKRDPSVPNVPTFEESGLKGVDVTSIWGIHAPVGTPLAVRRTLRNMLVEVMRMPDVTVKLNDAGYDIIGSTPEDHEAEIFRQKGACAKQCRVVFHA